MDKKKRFKRYSKALKKYETELREYVKKIKGEMNNYKSAMFKKMEEAISENQGKQFEELENQIDLA